VVVATYNLFSVPHCSTAHGFCYDDIVDPLFSAPFANHSESEIRFVLRKTVLFYPPLSLVLIINVIYVHSTYPQLSERLLTTVSSLSPIIGQGM
jgi:hypothetical protein